MMKFLRGLIAGLALAVLGSSAALAQCGANAPANRVCGNSTGSPGLATWTTVPPSVLAPVPGGTVFGNPTAATAAPSATNAPVLGIPGTSTGQIGLAGATSGTATIRAQAVAGVPFLLLPTTSGTLVSNTSTPFAIDPVTGTFSIPATGTAGQMFRSAVAGNPTWSTATWPATVSINNILYASGANAISGLASGNNGVLVTNGSGVPSISTILPSGLVISDYLPTTATMTTLRALAPGVYAKVWLTEYYSGSGDGFGLFTWNPASTLADNGGNVIQPNAGGTGRWIRRTSLPNSFTPEMFGARGDGATNDANQIDDLLMAVSTLSSAGQMQLSCGRTYISSNPTGTGPYGARGNGRSIVRLLSGVGIQGCGPTSVIKMANNTNTSGAFWYWGLYGTATVNNALYADFKIDMNGTNNDCGGTCYTSNAALGFVGGDNVTLRNITFVNNPGSNNTVIGSNVQPPVATNILMDGLVHEHNGDIVNAASADWSGDFFIASNVVYNNIRHSDGPRVNGSAFEIHGSNVVSNSIVVTDHFNCGIIASEPSGSANLTNQINLGTVSCNNVKGGVQTYAKTGSTDLNIAIGSIQGKFLTGSAGQLVDACSNMQSGSVSNTNLMIGRVQYYSDVTTNLGNEAYAVSACRWRQVMIGQIQTENTQGGAVMIDNLIAGSSITLGMINATTPGRTSTAANQVGVRFVNTSGAAAGNINIGQVTTTGTVQYNISGNVNATQTTIDPGSLAAGATIGQINWTGSGLSHILFPVGDTNLRTTGPGVLQQNSTGAAITVGQINAYSTITFGSGNLNPITQNATFYFSVSNAGATESFFQMPMAQAGTIDKLSCATGVAPAAGQTATFMVRKALAASPGSPADTALTTVVTGPAVTNNDGTHSFTIAANDLIDIRVVTSATTGTIQSASCSMRLATPSP